MIQISEDIQLIEITFNDQKKLMDLAWKIYPPEYKHFWKKDDCNWYLNRCYSIQNFKEELSEKYSNYYFIAFKFRIQGLIRFVHDKPLTELPNKLATYLHRIYLSEELQGKGVAQKLLNWVEQESKLKGINYIWLEAMVKKQRAVEFYKKNGFDILVEKQIPFDLFRRGYSGMYLMYKNI